MSDFSITEERFWSYVEVKTENECWPWRNTKTGKGYGFLCTSRAGGVKRKFFLAHRIAWMLRNHRAPKTNMAICHKCDNPPCCNPDHLFEGTDLDNIRDMLRKGRGLKGRKIPESQITRGVKHPLAKLSEANVRDIISMRKDGVTLLVIAKRFGVSYGKIGHITTGRCWSHITGLVFRPKKKGQASTIQLPE